MGPISSVFYSIGFMGVFLGLTSSSSHDDDPMIIPAATAAICLSLMMAKGAVYHAAFAYTCFLSKEISTTMNNNKKNDDGGDTDRNDGGSRSSRGITADAAAAALHTILELHQSYLRYIYKWAAISCILGSVAFAYCCLAISATTTGDNFGNDNDVVSGYPRYSVLFVPAMSAPVKKILKRYSVGGIVLCGGLTNLWNLCYFAVLYLGFSSPVVSL